MVWLLWATVTGFIRARNQWIGNLEIGFKPVAGSVENAEPFAQPRLTNPKFLSNPGHSLASPKCETKNVTDLGDYFHYEAFIEVGWR